MDYRALGKLERGDSRLRWEQAQRIAKALDCSPFQLVPEEDGLNALQVRALTLLNSMSPEDQARWLSLGAALLATPDSEQDRRPGSPRANAA